MAVLGVVVLPEALTTVRHDQLATTTDTRVLARRWLRQRGDGARVATELYGQPLLWAGSEAARGFRLQRVRQLWSTRPSSSALACDGTRYFLVASLTSERELARRGTRTAGERLRLLARQGEVAADLRSVLAGHDGAGPPDNTGIPFWYLEPTRGPARRSRSTS